MNHRDTPQFRKQCCPWGNTLLDEIKAKGVKVSFLIDELQISRTTFYTWLKEGPPKGYVSPYIEIILQSPGLLRKYYINEIKTQRK
tara:strand:+ start:1345 stop:1602 length:258 start_codon:yes stop_codon:yes gene_type:complete